LLCKSIILLWGRPTQQHHWLLSMKTLQLHTPRRCDLCFWPLHTVCTLRAHSNFLL
jgi:hypothetical protein